MEQALGDDFEIVKDNFEINNVKNVKKCKKVEDNRIKIYLNRNIFLEERI
jgi:hypothetical protein